MADTITTKKVTDLTENSQPNDADLILVGNAGTAVLRKIKWSNILAAIKTKIASWAFDTLTTTDKTLPGAINELNSNMKTLDEKFIDTGYADAPYSIYCPLDSVFLILSSDNIFWTVTSVTSNLAIATVGGVTSKVYSITGNASNRMVTIDRIDGGAQIRVQIIKFRINN